MIEITKKTKDKVIEMLTQFPKTKDNDNLLVGYIWKEELEALGFDIKEMPTNDFLNTLSKGQLTAYESIRRIRAKLQSENSKYRGANYLKRANKQEEIRSTLFDFDNLTTTNFNDV